MSISRGIECHFRKKTAKWGKHVNLEAIKFDDDLEMSVFIPEQQDSIRLVLSDELALADEVTTKKKSFICLGHLLIGMS